MDTRAYPGIELLRHLVNINSDTYNVSGVNQVQDLVANRLEALGFSIEFHENQSKEHISGRFVVGQHGDPSKKAITLVTHADTVFVPDPKATQFALDSTEERAFGPGIIDDKGGIVVALEGLRKYLPSTNKRPRIQFVCSPSEEIGSPGFHELLRELGSKSHLVLGFEPSLENGNIIESRRGNRWYHLDVEGKEAHVGRDFEKGINAAHELALKIYALEALRKNFDDITISTGFIQGGAKFNTVCGHAEAKLDFRFSTFESRDQVHEQIDKILRLPQLGPNALGETPSSSYSIADDCPPLFTTHQQFTPSRHIQKNSQPARRQSNTIAAIRRGFRLQLSKPPKFANY